MRFAAALIAVIAALLGLAVLGDRAPEPRPRPAPLVPSEKPEAPGRRTVCASQVAERPKLTLLASESIETASPSTRVAPSGRSDVATETAPMPTEEDELAQVALESARCARSPAEAVATLRALAVETETGRRRALVRALAVVDDALVRATIEDEALRLARGASALERLSGLEVLAALGSERGGSCALSLLGEAEAAAVDALPASAAEPATASAALRALEEVVDRTHDEPLRRLAAARAVLLARALGDTRAVLALLAHREPLARAAAASALEGVEQPAEVERALARAADEDPDAFARECARRSRH